MTLDKPIFNRYLNPFDVKKGIDTLPDFVPDLHYLQLKLLCNEAYLKIHSKIPKVCSIHIINEIIEEYDYLFNETEVWIVLYSAFDKFSFLYLDFCELKVFIEDYGKLCGKAIENFKKTEMKPWIDLHSDLFRYINNSIKIDSETNLRKNRTLKYSTLPMMVYARELNNHLEFCRLFKLSSFNKID